MSIQAMTIKQVAKAVGLSREQLYIILRATGLIVSVGFERVYQQRAGAEQSYMSERFEGDYIINSACGKRDRYRRVVPDQMLDSRIIDVLKGRLNEKLPEISVR